MSLVRRQDMPPLGGYRPIPFARMPPKSFINAPALFAAYLGITFTGFYIFRLTVKKIKREDIEIRSSDLAIVPMLMAEYDRDYLKQIRRNRDEERKLMANVEGWEVGKCYGEPIYKTISEDTFMTEVLANYYGHSNFKDMYDYTMFLMKD